MVQYGERLIARRKEFVEQINGIIAKIHQRLTGGKESLKIIYEPSTGDLPFEQALNRYRERDLRMKSTTVGPHRDDIGFLIGDMDIRKYGSQDSQRTAALSLKLSEIKLVKLATHDTPILLLDDVLSELDKHRQNYLFHTNPARPNTAQMKFRFWKVLRQYENVLVCTLEVHQPEASSSGI